MINYATTLVCLRDVGFEQTIDIASLSKKIKLNASLNFLEFDNHHTQMYSISRCDVEVQYQGLQRTLFRVVLKSAVLR